MTENTSNDSQSIKQKAFHIKSNSLLTARKAPHGWRGEVQKKGHDET